MAKSVTVRANEKGEYWLDVEVAGERTTAQIDSGYTGTGGGGACTVTEQNWNKIADRLTNKGKAGESTDYKGDKITPEYGKGKIKIVGLDTEVEKFITFAGAAHDLLGTTFLHNLANVTVEWNLRDQIMTFTEMEKEGKDEDKED